MKLQKDVSATEFILTGFFRPRLQAPGFAIPIFSREGRLWIQEIGNLNGKEVVRQFLPCEPELSHILASSEQPSQAVGQFPLFSFRFPNSKLIVGFRSEVENAIRASISQLENYPFVFLDCAEFLKDAQMEVIAQAKINDALDSDSKVSPLPEEMTPDTSDRKTWLKYRSLGYRKNVINWLRLCASQSTRAVFRLLNHPRAIVSSLNNPRHYALFAFNKTTLTCDIIIFDGSHNISDRLILRHSGTSHNQIGSLYSAISMWDNQIKSQIHTHSNSINSLFPFISSTLQSNQQDLAESSYNIVRFENGNVFTPPQVKNFFLSVDNLTTSKFNTPIIVSNSAGLVYTQDNQMCYLFVKDFFRENPFHKIYTMRRRPSSTLLDPLDILKDSCVNALESLKKDLKNVQLVERVEHSDLYSELYSSSFDTP